MGAFESKKACYVDLIVAERSLVPLHYSSYFFRNHADAGKGNL